MYVVTITVVQISCKIENMCEFIFRELCEIKIILNPFFFCIIFGGIFTLNFGYVPLLYTFGETETILQILESQQWHSKN